MAFVKSCIGKMQLWRVEHCVCCCFAIVPTQKWWQNEKSGQSCIHKEVTSYKIHTLERWPDNNFET